MAQVDMINYFSILFWFLLLVIVYYLINYTYLLPNLFSNIYVRFLIFKNHLNMMIYKFNIFLKLYYINIYISNFFIVLIIFFKKNLYVF